MSADNWAVCPKCWEDRNREQEKLQTKVDEAYGKVTSKEYLAMLHRLENPPKLENTLREEYELGILDGEFYVRYKGSCRVCGFSYEYKQDVPLEGIRG